ncbi:hypothetical protein AJ80_08184 [Polytolypa hystricis UAMH7299]|uniref:Apc15p protein n=1 Tax=Polytolypa hystricis (strain UAMH7299) TaxID=1447883 RepID=A0A2B7XBU3_POLH7|nr:hypothetical protein AJ80_08184 [Polytolypa hystricis UAMH7299]
MLSSLAFIEPRDSHTLWYTPSHPHHTGTNHSSSSALNSNAHSASAPHHHRPGGAHPSRSSTTNAQSISPDSLAALVLEERALRLRKQNIATFGYAWIRPAGCAKTMQGVREEEAEREEAAAAAAAEDMGVEFGAEIDGGDAGALHDGTEEGFDERDLDDDIPEADDAEGLVEDGEEGLDDEDDLEVEDEDALMDRDLDDDVPEGFVGDYDDDEDEDEVDLDDEIPSAPADYDDSEEDLDQEDSMMHRDLDADVPDPAEDGLSLVQQEEWEHTDTDADDDFDDDDDEMDVSYLRPPPQSQPQPQPQYTLGNTPSILPRHASQHLTPTSSARRETEAERLFLQRWSGGGDGTPEGPGSSPVVDAGVLHAPRRRSRRTRRDLSSDSFY